MSLIQQLFRRFRDQQATAAEQQLVEGWYDSYDNDPDRILQPADAAVIEQNIRLKISRAAGTSLPGWPVAVTDRSRRATIFSLSKRSVVAVAVAAVFIVVAACWILLPVTTTRTYTSLHAPARTTKKVTLPDGSQLTLQPGSSLSFLTAFDGDNREVNMQQGEVFYEIARDTTRPFLIHAGKLDIRVLGTAFAIRAVNGVRAQEVVVKHGKVQVSCNDSLLDTLTAGASLSYDTATGKATIRTHQLLLATQLEEGWLVLNNHSFTELQQLLQQRYAIIIEDPLHKLSTAHFSTLFKPHSQVREIMEILCAMQGVQYRLQGNTVTIY